MFEARLKEKNKCNYMIGAGGQIMQYSLKSNKYCGVLSSPGKTFLPRGLSMVVPKGFKHRDSLARDTTTVVRNRPNITTVVEYYRGLDTCSERSTAQLQPDRVSVYFLAFSILSFLILFHMVVV